MPSITDAIKAASNLVSNSYVESDPVVDTRSPSTTLDFDPGRNNMIRCPVPPLWQDSSDSQRQFYIAGKVPQMRFMTPNPSSPNSALTGNGGSVVIENGGSGGNSGGASTTATVAAAQSVITTPVLSPNAKFTGVLSVSKSFQLLSIAAGSPSRVQFYGTANAQSSDMSRGLDSPPPAGVAQNIITDVVLDTAPYQWSFQNRVGSNADQPQKTAMYVTITNLDSMSDAITLTLQYVPLESTQ